VSTIADVVTRIRVRIDETTARKWADSGQLTTYASEAEQWLANLLGKIPGSGRFRVRETFTLTASAETYTLSSFTNRVQEILEIQTQVGNRWVRCRVFTDGDTEAQLRNLSLGGGIVIPAYRLVGESIQFLPTLPVARSMAMYFRYMPTIKTSGTLETPDQYLGDLVNRAVHFALADAGLANGKFEEEYAARLAEIEEMESQRQYGADTERVRRRQRGIFQTR